MHPRARPCTRAKGKSEDPYASSVHLTLRLLFTGVLYIMVRCGLVYHRKAHLCRRAVRDEKMRPESLWGPPCLRRKRKPAWPAGRPAQTGGLLMGRGWAWAGLRLGGEAGRSSNSLRAARGTIWLRVRVRIRVRVRVRASPDPNPNPKPKPKPKPSPEPNPEPNPEPEPEPEPEPNPNPNPLPSTRLSASEACPLHSSSLQIVLRKRGGQGKGEGEGWSWG